MVSYYMHTPVFPLEFKWRVYAGILNVTTCNQWLTVIIPISDHLFTYTFGRFGYILRA